MDSSVEDYLQQISTSLRLMPEKIRAEELRELRAHLEGLTETYSQDGKSDAEAQGQAIAQFGNRREVSSRIFNAWLRPLFAYWGTEYLTSLATFLLLFVLGLAIPLGVILTAPTSGSSPLFRIGWTFLYYGGIVFDPIAGVVVSLLFSTRRQTSYLIGGSLYTGSILTAEVYGRIISGSQSSAEPMLISSIFTAVAGAALFPLAAIVTARQVKKRSAKEAAAMATAGGPRQSRSVAPPVTLHLNFAVGRFIVCEVLAVVLFACGLIYLYPHFIHQAVGIGLGSLAPLLMLAFLYAVREQSVSLGEAKPELLRSFGVSCLVLFLGALTVKCLFK